VTNRAILLAVGISMTKASINP